jgi:hypothetical protein
MPTVRLRDAEEYPEPIQKLFEAAKAWFKYDFHGRAMKRAMTPGEWTRAEKEMVAAVVSGVNACAY